MNIALNTARIELSAAKRARAEYPLDANVPELDARVTRAQEAWRNAANAPRDTIKRVIAARPTPKCCDACEEVRGTVYMWETRCSVHGTRTKGTAD